MTIVPFLSTLGGSNAMTPFGNPVVSNSDRPLRILLVEADPALRSAVASYLDDHGIRVATAADRQDTLRQIATDEADFVLLGLRLGGEDGLDLLRDIRARSDLPVVIGSDHACSEIDRVVALELGADDYIAKPYGLRELLARIRAILRRRVSAASAARATPDRGRHRFGEWELDRRTRRLRKAGDEPIALTKGEYALLTAFLEAPGQPLTREHLMQATRVHEDVFDRSIDVQILRLRRKLEVDPRAPRIIKTARGVGYVFDLPVERLASAA
jgi:DNA-binding response OmpR family regulator